MWPKYQFSSIFACWTILFFFLIDRGDGRVWDEIFGKIKSFPIFMKIGGSERSHMEIIILKYQHHPITDKGVISN